jgi:hypothetical protein
MKAIAVAMSLAIAGIALSSDVTPASASKMNGKCCQSSDGGRSHRHQIAVARRERAVPPTCSAYAAWCARVALIRGDGPHLCRTAEAQCLRTGVHAGPYSGRQIAGLHKR